MDLQDPATCAALAPILSPAAALRLERGQGLAPADLLAAQRALHALSPADKRALARRMEDMASPEAAVIVSAAAFIEPADFVTLVTLVVPAASGHPAMVPASITTDQLAAAHRALRSVPVPTRAVLTSQLPGPAATLVSLAADLDTSEFIEAARPMLNLPMRASSTSSALSSEYAIGGAAPVGGASAATQSAAERGVQSALSSSWILLGAQARLQLELLQRALIGAPRLDVRAFGLGASACTVVLALVSIAYFGISVHLGRALLAAVALVGSAVLFVLDADGAVGSVASATILARVPGLRTARGRSLAALGTALAALLAGGVLAIGGALLLLPALFGALAHQLAAPRLAELLEQLPTGAAASARFAAASGGAGVLHGGPSLEKLGRRRRLGRPLTDSGGGLGGLGGFGEEAELEVEEEWEWEGEPLFSAGAPLLQHGALVSLCPTGGYQVTELSFGLWRDAAAQERRDAAAAASGIVDPAAAWVAATRDRRPGAMKEWARQTHARNPAGLALLVAAVALVLGFTCALVIDVLHTELARSVASVMLVAGLGLPLLLLELAAVPEATARNEGYADNGPSLRSIAQLYAAPLLRAVPDAALVAVRALSAVVGAAALAQLVPPEPHGLVVGTFRLLYNVCILAVLLAAAYAALRAGMERMSAGLPASPPALLM